jgi:hypothetical protein
MPKLKNSLGTLALTLVAVTGTTVLSTPGSAQAAGAKTLVVHQRGPYVANLCLKNLSQDNVETCTGNVPVGSNRDLTIQYNEGDTLEFIVAVVAGHNAYYSPIADRDQNCWAMGTSLGPIGYCRVDT